MSPTVTELYENILQKASNEADADASSTMRWLALDHARNNVQRLLEDVKFHAYALAAYIDALHNGQRRVERTLQQHHLRLANAKDKYAQALAVLIHFEGFAVAKVNAEE